MFDFKNKKSKFCFFGMIISLVILVIVFYSTDGLLGDKEFSEYTYDDWSVDMLPLAIMIVFAVATLVFAFLIVIPMIFKYPALADYLKNKKFSNLELNTRFLVFDHNEFKRACCRPENQNGL